MLHECAELSSVFPALESDEDIAEEDEAPVFDSEERDEDVKVSDGDKLELEGGRENADVEAPVFDSEERNDEEEEEEEEDDDDDKAPDPLFDSLSGRCVSIKELWAKLPRRSLAIASGLNSS